MNYYSDSFADITIPGGDKNMPSDEKKPSDRFDEIVMLIKKSGSDKAAFKKISEFAWDYVEYDSEDVYIPGGANYFKVMTREQLRCYYKLRADFKKGVFSTKYPAYIYVYIAEVLIRENPAS
jgi:hypothetical protein